MFHDICWNVDKELRMDSPIHTEYLRSGGATALILMVDGAKVVNSFVTQHSSHCQVQEPCPVHTEACASVVFVFVPLCG